METYSWQVSPLGVVQKFYENVTWQSYKHKTLHLKGNLAKNVNKVWQNPTKPAVSDSGIWATKLSILQMTYWWISSSFSKEPKNTIKHAKIKIKSAKLKRNYIGLPVDSYLAIPN